MKCADFVVFPSGQPGEEHAVAPGVQAASRYAAVRSPAPAVVGAGTRPQEARAGPAEPVGGLGQVRTVGHLGGRGEHVGGDPGDVGALGRASRGPQLPGRVGGDAGPPGGLPCLPPVSGRESGPRRPGVRRMGTRLRWCTASGWVRGRADHCGHRQQAAALAVMSDRRRRYTPRGFLVPCRPGPLPAACSLRTARSHPRPR